MIKRMKCDFINCNKEATFFNYNPKKKKPNLNHKYCDEHYNDWAVSNSIGRYEWTKMLPKNLKY
jgi:hypothetical protein